MNLLKKPARRADRPLLITITDKGRKALEEYEKSRGVKKPAMCAGGAK